MKPAGGKITFGIEKNAIAKKTIEFVLNMLPLWRDDPNRNNIEEEKELNQQLSNFLDAKARDEHPMVYFHHEQLQSNKRSVDISAHPKESLAIDAKTYTIYDPVVVFECKRLTSSLPVSRKKEYVTGERLKRGGIQRFKLGLHGSTFEIVAMIGYIQDGSPTKWYNQINDWITELSNGSINDGCRWDIKEKLQLINNANQHNCYKLISKHTRSNHQKESDVTIHHLWVVMHNNN